MTEIYNNLEGIAKYIVDLDKKVTLLFAFNGTGKTRLSMEFKKYVNNLENSEDKRRIIYYNAFTEDLFSWDNDLENDSERKLKMNKNSSFFDLIVRQGKEIEIANRFKEFTSSKIEPNIDTDTGEITFSLPTGDNQALANIKVSRGEESIFIWTIFFVLMETIIAESNEDVENQSFQEFNDIEYIFIDDPISSLDDNRAIDIALRLKFLIKESKKENLHFIISTHHALFYNVLLKEINGSNVIWFSKNETNYSIKIMNRKNSPFGYHLLLNSEISQAINNNGIKRYHFNLLRNLFETTALFLGYESWKDLINILINEEEREAYIKRINLYSHSDYSAMEVKELEAHEKNFLEKIYGKFVSEFKFKECSEE